MTRRDGSKDVRQERFKSLPEAICLDVTRSNPDETRPEHPATQQIHKVGVFSDDGRPKRVGEFCYIDITCGAWQVVEDMRGGQTRLGQPCHKAPG